MSEAKAGKSVVLVMLDSDCPSPCFMFTPRGQSGLALASETLGRTLTWIERLRPQPSVVFLSSGTARLEPSVQQAMAGRGDAIVTTLVPTSQQEAMGLPVSGKQTVVAESPESLIDNSDSVRGRRVILHVEKSGLRRMSEALVFRGSGEPVIPRPRDAAQWQPDDFRTYEDALLRSALAMLRRCAAGEHDVSAAWALPRSEYSSCPAGSGSLTVGPDGRVYPCPAFYVAGSEHALGHVGDRGALNRTPPLQACPRCGERSCGRCLFAESRIGWNDPWTCRAYLAYAGARRRLLARAGQSGYLFGGLRTLRSRLLSPMVSERYQAMMTDTHIDDFSEDEFRDSILAILSCIQSGDAASRSRNREHGIEETARRRPEAHAKATSRRAAFREMVADIIVAVESVPAAVERALSEAPPAGGDERKREGDAQAADDSAPPCKTVMGEDMDRIRDLWNYASGCHELFRMTAAARETGFSVDAELRLVRQDLEDAQRAVREWFESTEARYGWAECSEYWWEVDCETGTARPLPKRKPVLAGASSSQGGAAGTERTRMERRHAARLGAADKEVVRRLVERRGSCADAARHMLSERVRSGGNGREAFEAAVRKLGASSRRVSTWFRAMARQYGWPVTAHGYALEEDAELVVALGPCENYPGAA